MMCFYLWLIHMYYYSEHVLWVYRLIATYQRIDKNRKLKIVFLCTWKNWICCSRPFVSMFDLTWMFSRDDNILYGRSHKYGYEFVLSVPCQVWLKDHSIVSCYHNSNGMYYHYCRWGDNPIKALLKTVKIALSSIVLLKITSLKRIKSLNDPLLAFRLLISLVSPVWMEFREFLHGQCNSLKLPRTMRGCRPSKWHPLFLLNCQMQTIWVSQKFKKDKSPFKRTSGFSQTLNNERPRSTAAQWESTTVARRVPWVFYLLWAVRLQVLFSYGIVPRMRYSPQERETDLLVETPILNILSLSSSLSLAGIGRISKSRLIDQSHGI